MLRAPDPQEQIDRAERRAAAAKALLDNPTLRDAFASLEAEYTRGWRESAPEDREAREECWRLLASLDRLKRDIGAVATGGAVAAFNHRRTLAKLAGG